ncbi:hypothetical protein H4R33_005855 [Dimargaris cristalligena]|nr:hypothetical protein H4R33_005855 [Dimargaris cristalligena]
MDFLYEHDPPSRYNNSESDSNSEGESESAAPGPAKTPRRRPVRTDWSRSVIFRVAPKWQAVLDEGLSTLVIVVGPELCRYWARVLASPLEPLAIAIPFTPNPPPTERSESYCINIQPSNPRTGFVWLNQSIEGPSQHSWAHVLLRKTRPQRVVVIQSLDPLQRTPLLESLESHRGSNTPGQGQLLCYLKSHVAPELPFASEVTTRGNLMVQGVGAALLTQCEMQQRSAYLLVNPHDETPRLNAWQPLLASSLFTQSPLLSDFDSVSLSDAKSLARASRQDRQDTSSLYT